MIILLLDHRVLQRKLNRLSVILVDHSYRYSSCRLQIHHMQAVQHSQKRRESELLEVGGASDERQLAVKLSNLESSRLQTEGGISPENQVS